MNMNNIAVELKNITKVFPNGVVANENIDFKVHYGEIHALFGENGAGKSTLIKILLGELSATNGVILINADVIKNHTSKIAKNVGMSVVHQHFSLIDNFSIFENVILGYEAKSQKKMTQINQKYAEKLKTLDAWKKIKIKKIKPIVVKNKQTTVLQKQNIEQEYNRQLLNINSKIEKEKQKNSFFCYKKEIKQDLQKIISKFDFNLDLDTIVNDISVVKKQKTEILKVLFKKAKIIVFDESTSVISVSEIDNFLNSLIDYRKKGKAIVFISHKIKEVKKVADRITVLRNGKVVGSFNNKKTLTEKKLVNLMVGNKVLLPIKDLKRKPVGEHKILNVKNLNLTLEKKDCLKNINLSLYKGEIVGLVGIEDNGQKHLLETLSQIEKRWTGEVFFSLVKNKIHNLKQVKSIDTKKLGIAYIPQDRQKEGLLIKESLYLNTFFNNWKNPDWFFAGFIKSQKILQRTNDILKKYDVRGAFTPEQLANSLSGGNQQKFIIGRELENHPSLLLINEPTWGIDEGMINHLNVLFIQMRNSGKTILFTSLTLDLVLPLCDRILVMSKGEIVGEVNPEARNAREQIGKFMAGNKDLKNKENE